jgi:hypothetical protein
MVLVSLRVPLAVDRPLRCFEHIVDPAAGDPGIRLKW